MSRPRRIVLNTLWLLLHQVVANVAALLVVGQVADHLRPGPYGELEGGMGFALLFTPIVFAGIQLILVREAVETPGEGPRVVGDALLLRLLLAPIFVGLAVLSAPFAIPQIRTAVLLLALANGFLMAYVESFWIAFQATERMHVIAVGGFVDTVVTMGLCLAAVWLGLGPVGVMGARLGGKLCAGAFYGLVLCLRFYRPVFRPSLSRFLRLLRLGLPLALQSLLSIVLLAIDKTMIVRLRGLTEAGLYATATTLAFKLVMVSDALGTAILPAFCRAWIEGREAFDRLLGATLRLALVIGLPVAVGTWFVAHGVMDFVFGDLFVGASRTLAILACFVPLQLVNAVLVASLCGSGRERFIPWGMGLAVGSNVLANAFLITRVGFEGAAVATVLSQALLTAYLLFVHREHLLAVLPRLRLLRVGIASVCLAGTCLATRGLHTFLVIGLGAVAYGALILLLRAVTLSELREMTERGRSTMLSCTPAASRGGTGLGP